MTPSQCRSRRGGFIPKSGSLPSAPTDGLDAKNPNWKAFGNSITAAAQASLKIFGQTVSMVVGLINAGQQSTASHLGLDAGSVFLQNLKDQGLIGARSFGLDVGSQSVEFPRRGNLVLGGYDQARFASSSFYEYNVTADKLHERYCPLQVPVTEVVLFASSQNAKTNQSTKTNTTVVSRDSNVKFCIEPYDNLFRLPSETVGAVKTFFQGVTSWTGGTVDSGEYSGTLLDLEPGLVYPAAAGAFNVTMRITINNEMTVEIPGYELWRPLRGLDSSGDIVLDDRYNELQIYGSEAAGYAPVLGKAFLSQVYVYVDYDAQSPIFRLADQASGSTTSATVSSKSCTAAGLSASDKGLIAVGSVLGVLILVLVVFAFYRYCCRPKAAGGGGDREESSEDREGELSRIRYVEEKMLARSHKELSCIHCPQSAVNLESLPTKRTSGILRYIFYQKAGRR